MPIVPVKWSDREEIPPSLLGTHRIPWTHLKCTPERIRHPTSRMQVEIPSFTNRKFQCTVPIETVNFVGHVVSRFRGPAAMDLPGLAVVLRSAVSHVPEERQAAEESLNQVCSTPFCL
ncbi:hypothetical protein BHE74_00051636 [Ensete ventricosum]|nr:hypothetical protein GW17_00024094 [Ensete ventricosum]RWW42776.1 hypothetical protein BHE74_00051636 [Ensete ventricosum]RZR91649.1 hypothetical protein BHM03_00019825 [Ensete ventricosum]